jgi:hypothetical protein
MNGDTVSTAYIRNGAQKAKAAGGVLMAVRTRGE